MIYVLQMFKDSLCKLADTEFSGFLGFKRERGNQVAVAMNMNNNLNSNESKETKNCSSEVAVKDNVGNLLKSFKLAASKLEVLDLKV